MCVCDSVPWQMERCCHFVDDLCRHHRLSEVFPSSVSLVPPAMAISVDRGGVVMQKPQRYVRLVFGSCTCAGAIGHPVIKKNDCNLITAVSFRVQTLLLV